MQPSTERLYSIFKPVIEALGLSLVDVEWIPARGGRRLGVYIARREGSVSLDDCAAVTRALDVALEQDSELTESYVLEVSSPGLDRVIKRVDEYHIFAGRQVALLFSESFEGRMETEGRLETLHDGRVVLSVAGDEVHIPLHVIKKAKLVFKLK
jgi:ribosome maturation factor RimP